MKKWDKIIILILVVIMLSISAVKFIIGQDTSRNIVTVKVGNEIVKEVKLNSGEDEKIYSFKFGENTGYIVMKNGSVRMKEMNRKICPRGICSETGWISKGYESIVCLPNKIVVSIEGSKESNIDGNKKSDIDGVAF